MKRFFAFFSLILGIFFLSCTAFLIWERSTPQRLSFANYKTRSAEATVAESTLPLTITIPEANISLPVIATQLNDGKWTAPKNGVAYLTSSPIPGEKGNSILYGHNWANLLGPLTRVKPGQLIDVGFAGGKVKQFRVEYTSTVSPNETHILNQTDDTRLTLYTCTGFLDTKRFVVVAVPVKSKST